MDRDVALLTAAFWLLLAVGSALLHAGARATIVDVAAWWLYYALGTALLAAVLAGARSAADWVMG